MKNEELQNLIAGYYSAVPEVKTVSVYAHPQERTVRIMINAGMSATYDAAVMDRLLEAEYAAYKEIERRMEEYWTLDVSYI